MSLVKITTILVALVLTLGSLSVVPARSALAQSLPDGVPDGSVEAEVRDHEDGDKFSVNIDSDTETVLLTSA